MRELHVIVDGANVVGSRPDGWWRDRAGAARRLAGKLVAALVEHPADLASALLGTSCGDGSDMRVHLVLEGAARSATDLPTHPQLIVHRAESDGDTAIAALVGDLTCDSVLVVTADRALRDRVQADGATAVGPSTLLRALPA
ncbi:MAG: hypothetical protein ACRDRK_05740 [Pseudonocardia sp.]